MSRGLGFTLTRHRVINRGVSGQQLSSMEADATTDIDPLLTAAPASAQKVLTCLGGINDLANGVPLNTVQLRLDTYCTNRRSAGWTVAVCTLIAHNNVNDEVILLNDWIRHNYTDFADYLIDFGALPEFNEEADTDGPNYVDGVHPSSQGYIAMGNEAARVLDPVVNN